jgi:hypothetical protein
MSNQSLADLAVQALAAVSAIDAKVSNEHPERHHIRAMKQTASSILSAAFTQAISIALYTESLQQDMRKLHEEGPTQ